jgi:uncharacterized protein
MTEGFRLESRYNRISGIVHIPEGKGPFPCVILSHGLISSKESSKYISLAERFEEAGMIACRFDYHGCGESGGNIEETTLTIRTENLETVTDFMLHHPLVQTEKIGLMGSSFGGSTSLVKAAQDARIQCVSLWATPFRLGERDDGTLEDVEFNESLYADFARYDLLAEASKVSCALVIHGHKDDVVPCEEGRAIYKQLKRPKKFELIKGGDHIFSVPAHREKAINFALNWFRRFFLIP